MQVVGQRRERRLARALERLADQPLVLAAGVEQVGPRLGGAGARHEARQASAGSTATRSQNSRNARTVSR